MPTGTWPSSEVEEHEESDSRPEISVCESRPGKAIFLESGNTDGWISSDLTVEVDQ